MYRNIIGVILVGLHISIITSGHVAKRRDTNNAKGELLNELECLLNQHREQSYVHAQMVNLDKLELMRDELRKLLILMEGIYDGVATCVEEGNPNQISTHTPTSTVSKAYANCHEALLAGEKDSAVYWIQSSGLNSNDSEFYAFCDMTTDGGGWTVIQRRINGAVDFNRTWQEYRWGFGSLDGEYWLGLEHIQQLTASEPTKEMELYIILNQFNGDSRFAKYSTFSVEGDQYRLETAGYKGTSGGDGLNYSNGRGSQPLIMTMMEETVAFHVQQSVLELGGIKIA